MILYLIKGIACSLILWAFHRFFLENERIHRFNRYYLLLAPVVSFIIPFVPLRPAEVSTLRSVSDLTLSTQKGNALLASVQATEAVDTWMYGIGIAGLLLALYIAVAAILLARFVRSIIKIKRLISTAERLSRPEATMVLLPGKQEVCTFLQYVLCSKNDYQKGLIPEAVLLHEFAHVKQRHSGDILLSELTGILYWFNPVMILYRRSVRLNHEFMADERVNRLLGNVSGYQRLLLNQITGDMSPALASGFNYSQTKKRMIMMKQTFSWGRLTPRLAGLSLIVVGGSYLFSDEIGAQVAPPPPPVEVTRTSTPPPPPPPFETKELPVPLPPPAPVEQSPAPTGATAEELADYKASFEKHKVKEGNDNGKKYSEFAFSEEEKERLLQISKKMTQEQRREQIYYISKMPVPTKNPPSSELFESFKKADVYGVWLDGKKVENSVLNGYSNTDIADYSVSKLYGAAKKGRSYTHQLDIETNKFFDANFKKRMADRYIVSEKVKFQPKQ